MIDMKTSLHLCNTLLEGLGYVSEGRTKVVAGEGTLQCRAHQRVLGASTTLHFNSFY